MQKFTNFKATIAKKEAETADIDRRGYRISVRGGGRDFLGSKLFSGIRNKIQEKRYKTHIV